MQKPPAFGGFLSLGGIVVGAVGAEWDEICRFVPIIKTFNELPNVKSFM